LYIRGYGFGFERDRNGQAKYAEILNILYGKTIQRDVVGK
jgi:hypothetical protein